jgi:hypothetical protein
MPELGKTERFSKVSMKGGMPVTIPGLTPETETNQTVFAQRRKLG